MGTELSIGDGSVMVAVPGVDQDIEALLRWSLSGSYRELGSLRVFNMISADQRARLVERHKLIGGMMGFDFNKVGLIVTQMLRGYLKRPLNSDEMAAFARDVAHYQRELEQAPAVPTWAVALACNSIRLGSVPEHIFSRPSTGALRMLCNQKVYKTRAEMSAISEVLKAEKATRPMSKADMEAQGGKLASIADDLRKRYGANAPVEWEAPTIEALMELAGSEEAFKALPESKRVKVGSAIGALADTLVRTDQRRADVAATVLKE